MDKDLFGDDIKLLPPDINEKYIRDRDKTYLADKTKRLRYLHKINSDSLTFLAIWRLDVKMLNYGRGIMHYAQAY